MMMDLQGFQLMFKAVGIVVIVMAGGIGVFFVVFGLAWLRIASSAARERREMAKDPEARMTYARTGRRPRKGRPQAAPRRDLGGNLCSRCWQSPCVCDDDGGPDDDPLAVRINGVWRRTRGGTLLDADA